MVCFDFTVDLDRIDDLLTSIAFKEAVNPCESGRLVTRKFSGDIDKEVFLFPSPFT